MWIVMRIQDFEVEPSPNQPLKLPFPIVVDKGKMIGFIPVYETLEDAKSEFPNADYTEVRIKV